MSNTKSPTVCSIFVASAVAGLVLLAEHYVNFNFVGLNITAPFTYVMGVATLGLAFSAWCGFYRLWLPLVAFWSITMTGGVAVVGSYTMDWAIDGLDWMPGAAVLLAALAVVFMGLLAFICWQRKHIRALEAAIALERAKAE